MGRISKTGCVASLMALFAATLAHASTVTSDGYTFTNFDFPNSGNAAGAGTNVNGISNNGAAVGFSINNNGMFSNFVRNANGTLTGLNLADPNAMAFGVNRAGDVVGQQNGAAFFLPPGGSPQMLNLPAGSTAFAVNDQGNIVGQYVASPGTPGFFLANNATHNVTQILAPSLLTSVNAQGINDKGLIVGFYLGTDGQDHGFDASIGNASQGILSGIAIADPRIPNNISVEPNATFVFSQILGVNDNGIAAGYYGDSTTSQHGFLYNTNTGAYTFLDDPAEQFSNGVEVTQITGINNSDEIAGFYSDASGVFHGFVACPTGMVCPATGPSAAPEPESWVLASFGLGVLGLGGFRVRRLKRTSKH